MKTVEEKKPAKNKTDKKTEKAPRTKKAADPIDDKSGRYWGMIMLLMTIILAIVFKWFY